MAVAAPTAPSAPAMSSPEGRMILSGISWATYESLLADHEDRSSPRFAFDRGRLEIMSPRFEHERPNRTLATLVEIVAEELGIEYENSGSTTFKRPDLEQGFAPDSSFYVRNEAGVRGRRRIDLAADPPPDLVIEVDLTSLSLDKFPIFAGIGVPELWRYRDGRVTIWVLEAGGYVERAKSEIMPLLTGEALTDWLAESTRMTRLAWVRAVRNWVRTPTTAGQG